jgi:hypothetical protein
MVKLIVDAQWSGIATAFVLQTALWAVHTGQFDWEAMIGRHHWGLEARGNDWELAGEALDQEEFDDDSGPGGGNSDDEVKRGKPATKENAKKKNAKVEKKGIAKVVKAKAVKGSCSK